jgi:hypothetical protein
MNSLMHIEMVMLKSPQRSAFHRDGTNPTFAMDKSVRRTRKSKCTAAQSKYSCDGRIGYRREMGLIVWCCNQKNDADSMVVASPALRLGRTQAE